ncbi:acetyltransferase [Actinocatenispora thailandica]|uniref:Acetyltransferase n=1 Tax=Actinocatenispora thailandica TaxID=227318 RepID=A0A7R7DUG7_9ACTN|nr:arylamine N-acetyltransferase [Actinocatenispora thailandica]BCJ38069.1 acetyltransferase [Actinocatenispora thailandica]
MIEATEYLARIGHAGPVRPDSGTLAALHRAHLATVPYENLGIQLGRVPALTRDALYRRIVGERRGGFCFELNGAFGLLLTELGFPVRFVSAAVNRLRDGESAWGNHLALLVGTERGPMLADVGFGDGFLAPLPLAIGSHRQPPFEFQLRRDLAGVWHLVHHQAGAAPGFEFRTDALELAEFAPRCTALATDPASPYLRTLLVQQPRADHSLSLRARSLTRSALAGRETRELTEIDEFAAVLVDEFGLPALPPDELAALWRRAGAQQTAWHAAQPARR